MLAFQVLRIHTFKSQSTARSSFESPFNFDESKQCSACLLVFGASLDGRSVASTSVRHVLADCSLEWALLNYIFVTLTMPKTRQQSTPRQVPARAAKRSRSEAADVLDASTSASKASSTCKPVSAAAPGSSSAKKQKLQPETLSANVDDKENTAADSQPRRSTRARTPRIVQEVTPGPGLVKPNKDQHSSVSTAATQKSGQKPGRQSRKSAQKQAGLVEGPEPVYCSATGIDAVALPLATAQGLKPDSSPLQELPAIAMLANHKAADLPTLPSSSQQGQASALQQAPQPFHSPDQPIKLPSPCTHPDQHGLPVIPHQQPSSPQKPDSPAAPALEALCPAPAAAQPSPHAAPAADHGSQEGSRHSSGHSNDHPIALAARKHLSWDNAGATSGPISAVSKPPLNRGAAAQAAPTSTSPPAAAAADTDESWWDPTDMQKVGLSRYMLRMSFAIGLTADTHCS